ncbi:MAG TPA: sensor histidine kinase [Steroidobacteraceae bacterium]|nr:sensor histidine kinase [Steroidobacteraceae bacterium]
MLTIQRRLLLTLLPLMVFLMLTGGYMDYQTTITAMNRAYDEELANETSEIASYVEIEDGKVRFEPGVHLRQSLVAKGVKTKLFAIVNSRGSVITGNAEVAMLAPPVTTEKLSLFNARIDDTDYRVAFFRQTSPEPFRVILAAPLSSRHKVQGALITNLLFIDFLALDGALLLVWVSVYLALRPLAKLQEHVEFQSLLQPLPFDETAIPVELRPFVLTFNHLLELLNATALRQRQFVANAAHQLRTPLAGLQAQLQLLAQKDSSKSLTEELVIINSTLKRLIHSTNQLLVLARAEESLTVSADRFQSVNLQMLVEQCVELYFDRAALASIDLGVDVAPVTVMADINLLEDLLNNLVDNALKYTPPGGQVTVRCGITEGFPFLEVEDSGPGIPESAREKVRERFYRQPDAGSTGSGLGLAIVDEICRVHRAKLVMGESPDSKGALIKVTFPR